MATITTNFSAVGNANGMSVNHGDSITYTLTEGATFVSGTFLLQRSNNLMGQSPPGRNVSQR